MSTGGDIGNMKITVDVINSQKVKDLTEEIRKQEKEILSWNAAMKAGAITQGDFNVKAGIAASHIAGARQELRELGASAGTAGRGIGQLAYAVDDLQYGFNAIVNNIPGIVMGLGGTAGIAGAAGIAAVAINQIVKHWGDITAAFEAWATGGYANTIKMLAEQAEEAAKAFEHMSAAVTKAQQAQASGVKGVITEAAGGAGGLAAILSGAMATRVLTAPLPPGVKPKDWQEYLEGKIKSAPAEGVKLVGQMGKAGPLGDQAKSEAVGLLRGVGMHAMAQSIDDQTPARQAEIAQGAALAKRERAEDHERKERLDLEEKEAKAWRADIAKIHYEALQRQKQDRLNDLEDKKDTIQARLHSDLEALRGQRPGQIIQGQKASLDLYQVAAGGGREEKAHQLREAANKYLKSIDEQMKKERRVITEH